MSIGYLFVNTPGIGGIVATVVIGTAAVIYFFLTRWIINGNKKEEE